MANHTGGFCGTVALFRSPRSAAGSTSTRFAGRSAAARGNRAVGDVAVEAHLHDANGEIIGEITYNGRVWLHDGGQRRAVEIPVGDRKTAAQHDAEGWADFIPDRWAD